MNRISTSRAQRRAWRAFAPRDGRRIDAQLRAGSPPVCPCCDGLLESRPGTRLTVHLPLDATGYDLDCRGCRRFWCVVRHTARSLRLLRMRRLAAAVRAVEVPEPLAPMAG